MKRKSANRTLRIEPLEARQLLSATLPGADFSSAVDLDSSTVTSSLPGTVISPPEHSHGSPSEHSHDHGDEVRLLTEVVPRDQATTVALRSGNWASASTWSNGVPATNSRVLIPQGFTVQYGLNSNVALGWVRVEGALKFDGNVDTQLRVETVVVDTDGFLEIGTQENPIAKSAVIEFIDTGPIKDWTQLGRGLVTIGGFSIWGAETTSFVSAAENPRAGDSSVVLSEVPTNWQIGGTIVFPGVKPPADLRAKDASNPDPDPIFREQHELRTIIAIDGQQVTFDRPLDHDLHWQLAGGRTIPVGYLSRNVTLRSENADDPSRRGHVMLMPGNNLDRAIGYIALENLGRTRADIHVTDPQMDEHEVPIPETLANIRGRYSLHIHKNGPDAEILVKGIAINGGLKWGVASHSSNVTVEDSISFNVHGAHFVTESGVETGAFRNNLAIFSMGAGVAGRSDRQEGFSGIDLQVYRDKELQNFIAPAGADFGMWGYGFWLQGPLVEVSNNQAFGAQREAFSFTTTAVGTDWEGLPAEIPLEALPEEMQAELKFNKHGSLRDRVPVGEVPFVALNNVAIGSQSGFASYFSESGRKPGMESVFRGGFVGNVNIGVNLYPPSGGFLLDDIDIENHEALIESKLANSGVTFYNGVASVTFKDLRIKNFAQGFGIPAKGISLVTGSKTKLVNLNNIVIDDDAGLGQSVVIELAESNFERLDPDLVRRISTKKQLSDGIPQFNIRLSTDFVRPTDLFKQTNRSIVWSPPGQPTVRIYFPESARDYELDSDRKVANALAALLPTELLDKTSLELWTSQQKAIHGVLAPVGAVTVDGVNGIVSPINSSS